MNRQDSTHTKLQTRCLWCGQPTTIIWVHGHGQCARCGTNIDECCRGETCAPANPTHEKSLPQDSN